MISISYIGCISVIINRFKSLTHYALTQSQNNSNTSSETKGAKMYIEPLLIIAPFYVLSFLETFCDLFPDMKQMYIGKLYNQIQFKYINIYSYKNYILI